ncbi:ABC transporter ATP-binding protein [Thermosipho ferrireducens]|uniref:ABC transporter ATP-binding protein n=1 Tax=Thermosipho ferrireducens TaxID=2571116 RepID=A0ABX7S694_9BACT|nr:ABC transporter ATP-binding protein [Thermosipho ferrireducens]QTA38092.1 ABC transporter ATP-binding protein [Thermosipho ferrireducens]
MIVLKEVGKKYKNNWALKNVNLKVNSGEVLGIIGKNGCGKTTLLKIIAGLLKPSTGVIKGITDGISYIPEKPVLIPELSLMDNMRYFASLRNSKKERIYEELEYFQLTEHLSKRPTELSKGLQQRLSMAIALLSEPDVLLMDEPTSGLDAESKNLIMEKIKKLKREKKTIFYVTHDDEEVEAICTSILILENGTVYFHGSVEEFWKEYERYVFATVKLDNVNITRKVSLEELKEIGDVIHVRSVGIREFLAGREGDEIRR